MLGFIKRLFGLPPTKGVPPLMVRLRTPSGFVDGPVELRAVWLPSGKTSTWTTQAAQGLCIVPWMGGNRLDLSLAHASRRARLALSAQDVFRGAREVWLTNDEAESETVERPAA